MKGCLVVVFVFCFFSHLDCMILNVMILIFLSQISLFIKEILLDNNIFIDLILIFVLLHPFITDSTRRIWIGFWIQSSFEEIASFMVVHFVGFFT